MLLHILIDRIKQGLLYAIKRYSIEIILILTAGIITVMSFLDSHSEVPAVQGAMADVTTQQEKIPQKTLFSKLPSVFVDVSGAVNKPGVYEATAGARIADLVEMAGGISHEADGLFVQRNFNMARMVGDQDKIYIPYSWDIALGTFTEKKRVLEYLQPLYAQSASGTTPSPKSDVREESNYTISINDASLEDLDTLPGVGPVTAQKIIESRPYLTVDEILSKKVMNQATFDKIKSFISL